MLHYRAAPRGFGAGNSRTIMTALCFPERAGLWRAEGLPAHDLGVDSLFALLPHKRAAWRWPCSGALCMDTGRRGTRTPRPTSAKPLPALFAGGGFAARSTLPARTAEPAEALHSRQPQRSVTMCSSPGFFSRGDGRARRSIRTFWRMRSRARRRRVTMGGLAQGVTGARYDGRAVPGFAFTGGLATGTP